VQRILTLGMLAALGGISWLFLQGGGLDQIAVGRADRAPSPTVFGQGVGSRNAGPSRQQPPAPSPHTEVTPLTDAQTVRIASFNIQVFGKTKASKPYVMNGLADIVRQFDLVAIQEIRTQDKYLMPNFVKLINQAGRKYDHVCSERIGDTNVKEQYAFVFDTEQIDIDFQSVYTVSDPDNMLHREPLVATFRSRSVRPDEAFTFTLINVHTDPDRVPEELDALAEVYRVVRRAGPNEDDIIILGDLNTDDRHLYRLGQLPGVHPLISGVSTNTRQNRQYDNLIIHQPSTTEYAGRSGVFDIMRQYNLSQQQALEVSDHFPVWAEFSVYERDYAGRIATRRRVGR